MARRYARDPQVDRSLRHSVRDGVAASVQGGCGEHYFNAFAVHLKATTGQIALLAALPPLVGSCAQLVSAWLGRYQGQRRAIILFGVRLQLLVWPLIVLLPLLFPTQAMPLFLICAVVYYAAGSLVSPQWSSLMGDLVPERKRGRYFAMRNRLGSVTTFLALVSGGVVLHAFDKAGAAFLGFAAIFIAATVGRMISIWHLAQMHDPPGKVAVLETAPDRGGWRGLRRSPLVRFSLFYAGMQGAVAIGSPFFAVYMLRDLHYSYLQFMAGTGASVLMHFVMANTWGRLCDTFGNRFVLKVTGTLIPLLPLLWMCSKDFSYLLLVQAFSGAIWSGFGLSAGNFVYDLIPSQRRVTYLAFHNVLANGAIFCGALLGGWVAVSLPQAFSFGELEVTLPSTLLWVFLVSSMARFAMAVGVLPRLREIRSFRPATLDSLKVRVFGAKPAAWSGSMARAWRTSRFANAVALMRTGTIPIR